MLTKLALLVAENAGWTLNKKLTPFLKPAILTETLPAAATGQAYQQTLAAQGGVPFYDWRVTSGTLPAGLTLDRFTGTLTGTPTAAGTQSITVELRDYDSRSAPVTRQFQLTVGTGQGTSTTSSTTTTTTTTGPDHDHDAADHDDHHHPADHDDHDHARRPPRRPPPPRGPPRRPPPRRPPPTTTTTTTGRRLHRGVQGVRAVAPAASRVTSTVTAGRRRSAAGR